MTCPDCTEEMALDPIGGYWCDCGKVLPPQETNSIMRKCACGQALLWYWTKCHMCCKPRQVIAPDMVSVPRRWVIAVNEFIEDWQKGDFELPELARLDAQAILEAAKPTVSSSGGQ